MKHQIIAQVEDSDRNIYLTIENGSLVSVNYSQGLGDIDLHFLTANTPGITNYVIKELNRLGDELYSPEFFFPSPYWDEQVKAIDDAIWKLIKEENERAEIIESIMLIENEIAKLQNQLTELRQKL
jgi:hypothetical protein